jgi:O-antigen ligase
MRYLLFLLPSLIVIPVGFYINDVKITVAEILILLLWAFLLLSEKRIYLIGRKFLFVLAFILVLLLSLLLSDAPAIGVIQLVRWTEVCLFVFLLNYIYWRLDLSPQELIVSLYFACFVGVIYIFFESSIVGGDGVLESRPGSFFYGAAFGVIPAVGAVLSSYALFTDKKYSTNKTKLLALLLIFVSAIIYTQTITWLFSFTLSMFTYIMLISDSKKGNRLIFIFLIPLGFVFLLGVVPILVNLISGNSGSAIFNESRLLNFSHMLTGNIESSSLGTRLFVKWVSAFQVFWENPWFGVGLGQLDLGMPDWLPELSNRRSDSQYLDLLASSGIFSLVFVLFINYWLLSKLLAIRKFDPTYSVIASKLICILLVWLIGGLVWAVFLGYAGLLYSFVVSISFFVISKSKFRQSSIYNS